MDAYVTLICNSVFSQDNLEIHRAGFKSTTMHNLSDLVQQAVATNVFKLFIIYLTIWGKILYILCFMKLRFHVATYVDFSLGNANWEP
jgi:hypothetical protein